MQGVVSGTLSLISHPESAAVGRPQVRSCQSSDLEDFQRASDRYHLRVRTNTGSLPFGNNSCMHTFPRAFATGLLWCTSGRPRAGRCGCRGLVAVWEAGSPPSASRRLRSPPCGRWCTKCASCSCVSERRDHLPPHGDMTHQQAMHACQYRKWRPQCT